MNLYTSDLHLGHSNIIKIDHRPFLSVDEMDTTLIKLWNDRVQKDDTVYIVGDFCYKNSKDPAWYLRQLKGHKILIIGNHDKRILQDKIAMHYFDDVQQMLNIKDKDKNIVLCHYPLAEWDGFFHDAWHIYGHIHNNRNDTFDIMRNRPRALNAGCMLNNYYPVSFRELVENNNAIK